MQPANCKRERGGERRGKSRRLGDAKIRCWRRKRRKKEEEEGGTRSNAERYLESVVSQSSWCTWPAVVWRLNRPAGCVCSCQVLASYGRVGPWQLDAPFARAAFAPRHSDLQGSCSLAQALCRPGSSLQTCWMHLLSPWPAHPSTT